MHDVFRSENGISQSDLAVLAHAYDARSRVLSRVKRGLQEAVHMLVQGASAS